jgi:hypothetical protein
MKRSMWVLFAAGLVTAAVVAPAPASAQVQAGVVFDRDGLRHFHLAIGDYYGYPVQTVSRWHPSWVLADELPVIYMLAREARVSPEVIIALREQGWSWIDITYHLRVDPAIYVSHLGPPYGVAHGYWRKPRRSQLRWLTDWQIIDYANVYFWAGYQRRPVREIIVIRERTPSWTHYARVEAPRVRVQHHGQAAPPPVQSQPRPAQPRQVAPAPSANRAPAPAANRAPASAANRPAAGRAPASATNRAPAPAAGRAPAPSANRAPAPAANRAPAPAANRAPAPAANRPSAGRAPAPAANRAPAPAAGRAPAPPANRAPAPAANRAPAPSANRAPAPAANRPSAGRAPAPAANRAPAPAANRAPAPAASRPAAARNTPPPANRARGGGG